MTDYSCCKEQIIARFSSYSDKINEYFDSVGDQKLYNCGQIDASTTKLYWIQIDGDKYSYSYFTLKGAPGGTDGADITCSADSAPAGLGATDYDGSVDGYVPTDKATVDNGDAVDGDA